MKILCVFGQHNYGDPQRGEGYEYCNFLPALRALGHEVEHFESLDRDAWRDFPELNRRLLEKVESFRPDVLFCVLMHYEVWLETLSLVRESGVFVVNWGTDDSWKYAQFSRYIAPVVDLCASTSHEAFASACREELDSFWLTQWAASGSRTLEPLPAGQCRYGVSFVGSAYGNRLQWVERLARRGIAVECFGHGWANGPVDAERIPQIYRESLISLNFGDSGVHWRGLRPYRSRQIKARVFEVPAAGGCLLTESADHFDEYYRRGEEVLIFEGEDDLVAQIQGLLKDPARRDAVAWAGYRRTLAEHLYETRFNDLLTTLLQRTQGNDANRMNRSIAWPEFERAVALHRPAPMLRNFLAWPFRMVWGERRGPRAARRLLCELSWRLAGRRTYTSSGWPGRLFYRES